MLKFFVQDFNHQQHHLECTYLTMQNYSIFGSFSEMNGILFHWHSGTQDALDSGKRWLVFNKCYEAMLDYLDKRAWRPCTSQGCRQFAGGIGYHPFSGPNIGYPKRIRCFCHCSFEPPPHCAAASCCGPKLSRRKLDPNNSILSMKLVGTSWWFQPTSTPPVKNIFHQIES